MSLKMFDSKLNSVLRNYEEIEVGSVRELNSSSSKSWFVKVYFNSTKYTISKSESGYEVQRDAAKIIKTDAHISNVVKSIKGDKQ